MFTKLRYAILVVLLKIVEINSQFSYPTFNGALQGDIIDLNYLTTGMIINVTLNWSGNSSPNITLAQQGLFMSSTTCSYSPYYFTLTVSQSNNYSLRVICDSSSFTPIPYTIQVRTNISTISLTDRVASSNFRKAVYKFTVSTTCTKTLISSDQLSAFTHFMYFSPIQVLQGVSNIDNGCASYLATPNLVVSFPQIGTYYFIIGNVQIADFKYLVDSNIVINMMCLDSCGDGIKQGTEQCDNGNITGCLNCIVDSYYSCGGNITANSCLCAIPNTRYNHTTLQCELDCLFIPFSTGILDRSTNTCGCLPGFYFNVICKINCSLIIGAIGSVTGSTSTCKCNSPRFYFDLLNFVCRINCSRIAGAIGSVFSSSTLCQCQSTFIFDPLNFVCRINCSLIARAIGSVVGSLTLCQCLQPFDFDQLNKICKINCSRVAGSIGSVVNSATLCQCQSRLNFNSNTNVCEVNCLLVPFSMNFTNETTSCTCQPRYRYHNYFKQCILNCSNIPYAVGNIYNINPSQCLCQFYFKFNLANQKCQVHCQKITNTLGIDQGQIDKCNCIAGFTWNITLLNCVRNCWQLNNTNGYIETIPQACHCVAGYKWSYTQCIQVCGDGIKTQSQQCDDGNNVNQDNCSNCKIMRRINKQQLIMKQKIAMGASVGVGAAIFIGIITKIIIQKVGTTIKATQMSNAIFDHNVKLKI